jgi:uncharacterized Zn finger protein
MRAFRDALLMQLAFSVDTLQSMAGEKVFQRGKQYFADGLVVPLFLDDNRLVAHSFGARAYRTEFVCGKSGKPSGTCTCPAMGDFGWCKHWVATGLLWLDMARHNDLAPNEKSIIANLEKTPTKVLLEVLNRLAARDPVLQKSLVLLAQIDAGTEPDIDNLAAFIAAYSHLSEFLEWDEVGSWCDSMEGLFDLVDTLIRYEHSEQAYKLLDAFASALNQAQEHMQDSGEIGLLFEQIREYRQ